MGKEYTVLLMRPKVSWWTVPFAIFGICDPMGESLNLQRMYVVGEFSLRGVGLKDDNSIFVKSKLEYDDSDAEIDMLSRGIGDGSWKTVRRLELSLGQVNSLRDKAKLVEGAQSQLSTYVSSLSTELP